MYAYISLNLYQQKQISWFAEPPYSELLQELSGGIRGSPLSASFIHGIYYVYISLSCLYFMKLFRLDTQSDTQNSTIDTHNDTQKNTQNSTQWHTKTCVFPCAIVCDGLIQPAAGLPAPRRLPGKRVLCGTVHSCSLSLCTSRSAFCPNHSQNFCTYFSLNFPWQIFFVR